jgi:hypothetical protein
MIPPSNFTFNRIKQIPICRMLGKLGKLPVSYPIHVQRPVAE